MLFGVNGQALTPRVASSSTLLPQSDRRAPRRDMPSASTPPALCPQQPPLAASRCTTSLEVTTRQNDCFLIGTGAGPSKSRPGALSRKSSRARIPSATSNRNNPFPARGQQAISHNQYPKFFIGIETEFLLQGRDANTDRGTLTGFLAAMTALYNAEVDSRYPRMGWQVADDDWWLRQKNFEYWILTEEENLILGEPGLKRLKWAIEMKSPKIEVSNDLDWASQVKETWAFLKRHYVLSKTTMCGTHVHISMQRGVQRGSAIRIGMGLQNMKKIAQCVIHFEPALEALVAPERRGNLFAASNWIDNMRFAARTITRLVAIEAIGRCARESDLINLMCPPPQERCYAWNFRALKKFGTIEFRKGTASLNADEALAWAEFTLLFVQAAMQVSLKSLVSKPANIAELKGFLGVEKLNYLKPMFDGKDGTECLQPELLTFRTTEFEAMLLEKLKDDADRQRFLAKEQPY